MTMNMKNMPPEYGKLYLQVLKLKATFLIAGKTKKS